MAPDGPRPGRCPGPSAQDILAQDRTPAPAMLAEGDVAQLGTEDLPTDAYTDYAFHRSEVEKVWARCWQLACREDALEQPGSMIVYDIVDDSAIVLRDRDGTLRAFVNSCPHRGTRLVEGDIRQQRIRCPFHGLTWGLDGGLETLPCAWDFEHVTDGRLRLQPVQVGSWGGFVFVNFDPSAPPLKDYLEILPAHFDRWAPERRFTAAHVMKRMACNWKVALEAFIEVYHVIGLHSDQLATFADANSQYDVWQDSRHVSRMINLSGVPSPHVAANATPERTLAAASKLGLCPPTPPLAPGESVRDRVAACMRAINRDRLGVDLQAYSDSEVMDVLEYYLFPNMMLFGGFGSPLVYRARPDGDDPNACLFEVWLLLPYPDNAPKPAAAPFRRLKDDEPFTAAPELSYFAGVLDQDAEAMPRVQRGLRASRKKTVTLGRYQELRIRHMRRTLAEYLAAP